MTATVKQREVRFRTPLWWAVLMIPAFMTPTVAAVWVALGLLLGNGPWPALGWPLVYALAGATAGGILGSVMGFRRRPWVRVSDAGIELASRGAPIFVEWANVASVAVHRWGPFAVLDVVPSSLRDVIQTGMGAPTRSRQIGGRAGFRIGLGDALPRPRTLRRVLSQYSRQSA